jgi:hypothetical protein
MTSALDAYCALDLTADSAAAKHLLDRLGGESGSNTVIDLTKARRRYDAKTPGGLTPAMAAWYSARIAGPRGKAIAEIHNAFHNEKMPAGSPKSTFLEVQRDEARARSLSERIDQTAQFLDHNRALLDEFSKSRFDFNTLKARYGREPVKPRPIVYILALIGLVMLEAFINFESFMKVPYITSPFLATGATLAVACAIATASHYHGVVMRQWNYLFSPQDPSDKSHASRRNDAIRRLALGGLLLAVALAMVGGSRYYYLREYIMQARILGSSPPSMMGGITFMLFGNVVAYLVAVLVSYALHDPDPNYAEKDRQFRQASRRLEAVKVKRKALQESQRQGLDNALSAETNHAANAKGPNHLVLRSHVDQVVEKDQEVVAILLEYRNALAQSFADAGDGDEMRFRLPEGAFDEIAPASLDRMLSPRQYASEQIVLGFASGEN